MGDDTVAGADLPPGRKWMPCRYCGKQMMVGVQRRKLPRHDECGLDAAISNMRQMMEKSGPHYDKWLAGEVKYFDRIRPGGAPETWGQVK